MEENVKTDELEATQNTVDAKAQRKAEKKSENKRNKKKKTIITTTYFITVLCLLAGLLAPLFNYTGKGADLKQCMMLQYVPDMINKIIGRTLIPVTGWFKEFVIEGGSKFDYTFMSVVGSLYAVVCVLAIVACVFVFLGSKKKNTSANFALGIEVLTLLVTMTYIVFTAYNIFNARRNDPEAVISWTDYNLLIPAGGALLMAIIQTVTSKGSAGFSKVIALLFSAIGLVTLLDLTIFIPKLINPLGKLSELLHCGDVINFISINKDYIGVEGVTILFEKNLASYFKTGDIVITITYVLFIALSLLTVVNFVFDIIDLWTGKPTKKIKVIGENGKKEKKIVPCRNALSNSFAIVRYVLAILITAGIICITFFTKKGIVAGVYLYVLAVIVFIQLVNAAFRTAVANARYKKAINSKEPVKQESIVLDNSAFATDQPVYAQETSATYEQPAYDQSAYEQPNYGQVYDQPYEQQTYDQTAYAQPAYEQPLQQEPVVQEVYQPDYVSADYLPDMAQDTSAQPYVEPVVPFHDEPEQPVEPTPVYYYGGDTDEFMDTLTDNEKVEFVELFVKKSKGSVNGVPDYVIHEDNSDFFPAVFVHINRYRSIVSDELMSKMYKQLGKIM